MLYPKLHRVHGLKDAKIFIALLLLLMKKTLIRNKILFTSFYKFLLGEIFL